MSEKQKTIGLQNPDSPGNWRLEEYYQMALEDEPRTHISHWEVWEMKSGKNKGELFASNKEQTIPVRWLGQGNQQWIKED